MGQHGAVVSVLYDSATNASLWDSHPDNYLPLFTARGLPGPLFFLGSGPTADVRKLAWELLSSSDPEDSSGKGMLLICVAFCVRKGTDQPL
eukprot:g21904.t1